MSVFFRSILVISLLTGLVKFASSQNVTIELSQNKVVVKGKTYFLHKVKAKQTLFSIAKAYGVELSDVMKANQKAEPSIQLGEVLRIPIVTVKPIIAPILIKKEDDKFYYHVVKKGETLFSLYRKYGMDMQSIKNVNPGLESGFAVGHIVKIPKVKVEEKIISTVPKHDQKYFYYTIKKGDTEYSIAQQFSMKLRRLRKLNPKLKSKALRIGDWVRIPKYLIPREYLAVLEQEKDTISKKQTEIPVDTINKERFSVDRIVQKKIKIGLFLPLYLEANDSLNTIITYQDTLKIVEERNPKLIYPKSRDFIRFYQGILLAVDSLQKQGLSVELHVFDTERDPARVRQVISKIQFIPFDFFIGPVYQNTFSVVAEFANSRRIPLLSPLSAKNTELKTNPFVIQLNTSVESICAKIADYICFDSTMENLVVIHPERYQHFEEYQLVKDVERNLFERGKYWENDKMSYKKISFDEYGLFGIERTLSDTCENVIILPSTHQPVVENIMTNLNVLSQRYDIRLIGFRRWQRYHSLDLDVFYNLNLNVISPYCIDYKEEDVQSFVADFRTKFLAEPNDFSFRAFDMCLFFATAVSRFGAEFPEHLNQLNLDLLQANYQFKRVNAFGGLENQGVYNINYSRDFKIRNQLQNNNLVPVAPDNVANKAFNSYQY